MNTYVSKIELYNKYDKNDMSPRSKDMLINKLIEYGIIAKVCNI